MRLKHSVIRILAVAALLAWVPDLGAVNITYNLQSYDSVQEVWSNPVDAVA